MGQKRDKENYDLGYREGVRIGKLMASHLKYVQDEKVEAVEPVSLSTAERDELNAKYREKNDRYIEVLNYLEDLIPGSGYLTKEIIRLRIAQIKRVIQEARGYESQAPKQEYPTKELLGESNFPPDDYVPKKYGPWRDLRSSPKLPANLVNPPEQLRLF